MGRRQSRRGAIGIAHAIHVAAAAAAAAAADTIAAAAAAATRDDDKLGVMGQYYE